MIDSAVSRVVDLARLLNWIAVLMLLVLSAGNGHASSALEADHGHYEHATALNLDEHLTASAESERPGEPTLHCGAPMLGLGPYAVTLPTPCTPLYLRQAPVSLYGNAPVPDPEPPKVPLTT